MGIAKTIAEEYELKQTVASQIIATLAETATKEVKENGKFVFPGFCMVKTRLKPATKAGNNHHQPTPPLQSPLSLQPPTLPPQPLQSPAAPPQPLQSPAQPPQSPAA